MKILGWILFLAVSNAHAQQVIEGAPLSVDDDGGRKIITRGEGSLAPKTNEKAQIVAPPPRAEALSIPNDEVVNPPAESSVASTKKSSKSKKKEKVSKAIAQEMPKETIQEKMAKEKAEVVPAVAPAPVVKAPVVSAPPVAVEPVKVVTPPRNPVDGQLRLGPSAPVATVKKVEVVKEVKVETQAIAIGEAPVEKAEVVVVSSENPDLKKYLQFSFGFVDSNYEKIHSSLDNGSIETSFRFVSDISQNLQSGFAVEILSDSSGQSIPDNIRVLQYRLFADYHAPLFERGLFKVDWVGGLAFSIGDFGVKRRYLNAQGEEVSVKIKSGSIIGLIPSAGMRFYLVGKSSFDLVFEYHQYFGNPQKYIGGLAVAPRVSFEF